jgi:hypothetical protein
VLRLWVVKLIPFMHRWSEAAPAACCGVCRPCLTATASGLTLEALGARRPSEDDGQDPAQLPRRV